MVEKNLYRFPCTVFDFDGVLVKLDVDWSAFKADVRQAIATKYDYTGDLHSFSEELNQAVGLFGGEMRTMASEILRRHECPGGTPKFKPLEHIWAILSRHPGRFAIASNNSRQTIAKVLSILNRADQFEWVIGFEDVKYSKPHPEGLMMLIDRFGCKPDDILFVGDRETDSTAARAAGVPFAYVADYALSALELEREQRP